MARKAFEMMMEGMADAIAYVEGDQSRGRVAEPIDVKTVRARTKKSQTEFARTFRLPIGTVRDWEQRRRRPDAPARVLLGMIEADPEGVERLVAKLPYPYGG